VILRGRVARQFASLWLLPLVLAGIVAIVHPRRPQWSVPVAGDEITVEQALRAVRVLWIDARSEADYRRGHIPSAVLLNEDSWEKLLPAVLSAWQPDDLVIVYCDSGRCDASRQVAQRLTREAGIDGVKVLKGGWQAWSGRPQSAK